MASRKGSGDITSARKILMWDGSPEPSGRLRRAVPRDLLTCRGNNDRPYVSLRLGVFRKDGAPPAVQEARRAGGNLPHGPEEGTPVPSKGIVQPILTLGRQGLRLL